MLQLQGELFALHAFGAKQNISNGKKISIINTYITQWMAQVSIWTKESISGNTHPRVQSVM